MKRRTFIAGLGAAAAWPLAAGAQQALPAVGWLSGRTSEADASVLPAFRRGLHDQGFDAGRNVLIEYRWANTQLDQLPSLAVELVKHQVGIVVLVGATESKALEAIQATGTATSVIGVFRGFAQAHSGRGNFLI